MNQFSLFNNFSLDNSVQKQTLLSFIGSKGLNLNLTENIDQKIVVLTGENGVGKSRLLQLIREYIVTIINKDFPNIIVRKLDYGELDDKYDPDSTDHPLVAENVLDFDCNQSKWENLINNPDNSSGDYFCNIFSNYYHSNNSLPNLIKNESEKRKRIYFGEFRKYFRRQILKKICFGSLKQMLMLNIRYEFEIKNINDKIESISESVDSLDFKYKLEKNNKGFVDKSGDVNERIIFVERNNGLKIKFNDLSPGERLTLHLILLIKDKDNIKMEYSSQNSENNKIGNIENGKNNHIKQVLLLDEPDSHCHSSLLHKFINILQQTIINEMKIQVIMTTHNYWTINHDFIKNNIYSILRDGNNLTIKKSIDN